MSESTTPFRYCYDYLGTLRLLEDKEFEAAVERLELENPNWTNATVWVTFLEHQRTKREERANRLADRAATVAAIEAAAERIIRALKP